MHDYELGKVQTRQSWPPKTSVKTIIETTKQRRKTKQFIRGVIVLRKLLTFPMTSWPPYDPVN